jgi:predicted oxidoreductase
MPYTTSYMMNKTYLSDSGPKVSPAIYGFHRWTEPQVTADNMERIFNYCISLGINTFDHADTYGGYNCELVFGKVFAKSGLKREDVVLFSQCGTNLPHKERSEYRIRHFNTSADHIRQSVERSLNNLQTDYLDVFLLNQLDPISDLDETAIALQQLKNAGKIRHIGIVNFSVFQHQLLSSRLRSPIVSNHIELNLLNTSAFDNGQIDYIKQRYMRPLALSPLADGLIAEGNDEKVVKLRKMLTELASHYKADLESIAVAWLLKLGAMPVIGTLSEQRISRIVEAFDIELDHQDWYALYGAVRNENLQP